MAAWMEERSGGVPDLLRLRIRDALSADSQGGTSEAGGDSGPLLHGALQQLHTAMARTGRERESAFVLLTSDALFTLACERVAEAPDPERALRGLLHPFSPEAGK